MSLSGTVRETGGDPVIGAVVNLSSPDGELNTLTDADGRFLFSALDDREYRLRVSSIVAGYLFPSVHALLSLNALTHSDLANYLAYQDRLAEFHERMRLELYPGIFREAAVSTQGWSRYAPEVFRDSRPVNWPATVLPLFLPHRTAVGGRAGSRVTVRGGLIFANHPAAPGSGKVTRAYAQKEWKLVPPNA
ncbi:carboxypeptidase regulatory-like domain-containing protein [Lewinella sp. IMCC34183]|uniref:carboxypeptidase regulatory-like domain-containing protein n=1 Tax=Lewinella sp. IMCC34183 TaxID=2248762 RepID=UPI000E22011E|nr:carboxypeptidase regulatory-like domain-containing protein [Lewinella sp. IMCC34183]